MMKWRQSMILSLMLTDIDWRANIYKEENFLCETFVTIVVVNRKYKSFADGKFPKRTPNFWEQIVSSSKYRYVRHANVNLRIN